MAIETVPFDFREFLKLLVGNRVEYLVVGGYAVAYHGYVRSTADMDVWISPTPDNAARLRAALRQFGTDPVGVPDAVFLEPGNVFRIGVPPLRLEIITSVSGLGFDECFARRVVETIDGVPVSFISLADLKRNKQASGRLKDLVDLEHLP